MVRNSLFSTCRIITFCFVYSQLNKENKFIVYDKKHVMNLECVYNIEVLEKRYIFIYSGGFEMIVYHGTTKEKAESIVKNGFLIEKQGENGSHFGNGVYLTTTKKRAKVYGKSIVTVEIDESKLANLSDWLKEYKNKCQEFYEAGTPAEQVNTAVGEHYKKVYTEKGFTGILLDSIIGTAKEVVVYDMSIIQRVWK